MDQLLMPPEARDFTRDDLRAAIMSGAVARVRPKMMPGLFDRLALIVLRAICAVIKGLGVKKFGAAERAPTA